MDLINFFGTGSAFNTKLGPNCAFISLNHHFVFIDAGEGLLEKVKKMTGLTSQKNISFIITHPHPDHISSLGNLIYWFYHVKGIRPTVFYPGHEIKKMLTLQGLTTQFYEYHSVDTNYYYPLPPIHFSFIPTNHYPGINSYGILFEMFEDLTYYSGDSNEIPDKIQDYILKNKLLQLYQDTSGLDYPNNPHLAFNKLLSAVPEAFRGNVFCMHLDETFDTEAAKSHGFQIAKNASFD